VAEDNATNLKLVVTLLQHRGHSAVVASNGREAAARAAEESFDCILMDVQMPEMDGLEATGAIRRRERATGAHVPIVAMTAHAMTGDRERCLQAGMDAYVSKPLRPDELLAVIDGLFVATPDPDAVEPGDASPEPKPALDVPGLLAGLGGNGTLLGEIIDVFLADSLTLMADVRRFSASGDATALAASAHALKGSIGLFTQTGAYDGARQLERAAKRGELTGVDDACVELERDVARLRAALGDLRRELEGRRT
jgi:CheY-like chemotaxis protein